MKCIYCRKDSVLHCIDENLSLCVECLENLQIRWDEYVTDSLAFSGTLDNKEN
jgi:hypothetical protein